MAMQVSQFFFLCIFMTKIFGKELDHGNTKEKFTHLSNGQITTVIHSGQINTTKKQSAVLPGVSKGNGPYFIYPPYAQLFKKDKYFGGILDSSNVSNIIQLNANDSNSEKAANIEYSFVNSSSLTKYFTINPLNGLIRSLSSVCNISAEWPIRLFVEARDGPTDDPESVATSQVIVNRIRDEDVIGLLFCGISSDEVREASSYIIPVIERTAQLIVRLENITAPPFNSSNNATSAIWLYFIDPQNETVLPNNSVKINKDVLSQDALNRLTKELSEEIPAIYKVQSSPYHFPYNPKEKQEILFSKPWSEWAILIIAILIGLLGIASILYLCILWSRYMDQKEKSIKAYVSPIFDPMLFIQPNPKAYETQELEMNVPLDDSDSANDLQLDLRNKNHSFDDVNYITRLRRNGVSSSSSDEATSRALNVGRHNNMNHVHGNTDLPYHRSKEDIGVESLSPSNRNVTFRDKKDYKQKGFNYLKNKPIHTSTAF